MRRSLCSATLTLSATLALSLPLPVFGQGLGAGATPMALDLRKVPVGSWAEYTMNVATGAPGGVPMKSRWALTGRDDKGNTLEMTVEGAMMAQMGGKMTMKMLLAPDPVVAEKPVKQLIMQMGGRDPMEMPLNMPGAPTQKFQKPDPKKLVGKEEVKVAAGTFKTSHYRDTNDTGTVDIWISEDVKPLGIVKVSTKPKAGATGPNGQPVPAVSMELVGRGKDAKSAITKPAKPFDPAAMFGGPPPGAAGGGAHGPGPGSGAGASPGSSGASKGPPAATPPPAPPKK